MLVNARDVDPPGAEATGSNSPQPSDIGPGD